MAQTIRAVALVGFYRGDLVEPGTVLDLGHVEFAELKAFNKVDHAPEEEQKASPKQKAKD